MVEFTIPFGMKFVYGFLEPYLPKRVPPVSWRQLIVMCWVCWRYRHSVMLPEILDCLYWDSLPQSMKQKALAANPEPMGLPS